MAFDTNTERNIALKKLLGKAHTSNDKGVSNELLPSSITLASNTVFGEVVPVSSISGSLWGITGGIVERVQLSASFIAGTDTNAGRHGFQLSLPSTYTTLSSNPKKGTGKFVNGGVIQSSAGGLQLVPTSFSNTYEAEIYYGSPGSLTRVAVADVRDWNLDYFNGVLFQETPPGTGAHAQNPTIVNAYLYIGDYLDTVVAEGGGGTDIIVKDEGSNLTTTAASLDFVGTGVTATTSGNNVTVTVAGGISYSRTAVVAHTTSSVSDRILGVSATASLDIRLPAASGFSDGQYFTVKDEAGNADSNNITIKTTGADTIDGQSSIILASPNAAVNLYSNGSNKFFVY